MGSHGSRTGGGSASREFGDPSEDDKILEASIEDDEHGQSADSTDLVGASGRASKLGEQSATGVAAQSKSQSG